jgi:hypothetical protein
MGVAINALDNPGWLLRVDLQDTPLRDVAFASEAHEDDTRWTRFWKDASTGQSPAVGDA